MLRKANVTDKDITYNWVNDPLIRKYSYSKTKVLFEDHYTWFKNKLESKNRFFTFICRQTRVKRIFLYWSFKFH